MELGSIFLTLALLALVVLFVSHPLISRNGKEERFKSDPSNNDVSSLITERDRILNYLQELELDFAMGKVPEESYTKQRTYLLKRGSDVLRTLDSIQSLQKKESEQFGEPGEDDRESAGFEFSIPDDEIERMLAERRRKRQEKSAGFCPMCGTPVQKSDLYCPKCGAKLNK